MPTKAAYRRLEEHPDEEFDHVLAEKLGKTVAEVRQMSNDEWVSWSMYFARKAQREDVELKKAKTKGR